MGPKRTRLRSRSPRVDASSRSRAGATVRRFFLVAALGALVGCSSITPARMVPDSVAAERTHALQVRIRPVTGARSASFGGAPFPSNEALTRTIVATLQQVKAFAVVSESSGDVELQVSVLAQDQQGLLPTTARMVANYRFVGRNSDTIWSETYDTSFSAGDLGGSTRTVKAQEGAVRENLKAFVQGIKDRWPSR